MPRPDVVPAAPRRRVSGAARATAAAWLAAAVLAQAASAPGGLALAATTGYDARTGALTLRALPVVQGGRTACYDALLATVAQTPATLELRQASAVACEATTAGMGYDADAGTLVIAALPIVTDGAGSCLSVALHRTSAEPIRVQLDTAQPVVCPAPPGRFGGSVVLGAPGPGSVHLTVSSPSQSGRAWVIYGTAPDVLTQSTAASALRPGTATTFALASLQPDTDHHYRLVFEPDGGTAVATDVRRFHTARPAGRGFVFTVQADSHLDENSDLAVYQRTLDNIAADAPDFHLDLGDTFMTEKHSLPLTPVVQSAPDEATVNARYAYEHANFGRFAHSTPLFLVNGNHDGELGWLNAPAGDNLAVWATRARLAWFADPRPDGFYAGDTVADPFVGERAAWYAWQWGDAQFIVLDPFWNSAKLPGNDGWGMSLGDRQTRWLAATLAASSAKFRFVFVHNLVGGLDGQMRGGVEAAPYFEWGGKSLDGSDAFAQKRPGWAMPIHALLVKHRVTAVFHGHDHLYARQVLDGVVYQAVPQPSAKNFSSGATLAADYHYTSGTIRSSSGHLRVEVAPEAVTARYVRSWLPSQENAQRRNGQIDDTWTVAAPTASAMPAAGRTRGARAVAAPLQPEGAR